MNVTWTERAYDMLADIYIGLTVTEQRVLAATIARVESTLAASPLGVGESRDGAFRVWTVPPILVRYHVAPAGVTITRITRSQPERLGEGAGE